MSPLCVDLDGTLIRSDLLLESFLLVIKRNPLLIFLVPLWLVRGKAVLKAEIARRVDLDPAALPYDERLIVWLAEQKRAGRALWLCTASNQRLAESVANHVGLFDGVLASSDRENLSGRVKADRLVREFGARAFDYCGNDQVDLPIWQVSRGAIVVNCDDSLVRKAASITDIVARFPRERSPLRSALKALRPHQWVKNLLLLVPLATAHRLTDIAGWGAVFEAFVAFSLCASSVYVLNDMLDLQADRAHPRKRLRPFASGDLSLLFGFVLAPGLLLVAGLLALRLPPLFAGIIAGYYVLTLAYSFWLKRQVVLDTLALAALYTVRIVAGAAAIGVPLSFWLLLFSIFLFLSLALVKRYAELEDARRTDRLGAAGRGYGVDDLPILLSLGIASGYLSVLVLALYIRDPVTSTLYQHAEIIWLLCMLLLYWISRVWLKTHRGEMHDDPVVFALKDRVSLGIGLLGAVTVWLAI